jgi:hypothetical protein
MINTQLVQSLKAKLLAGETILLYPNTEEDTFVHSLVDNVIDGIQFVFNCIDPDKCVSNTGTVKPCCSITAV